MYLLSLANATPPQSFSQPALWEVAQRSQALSRLREGSRALLERVLLGESGIRRRQFALHDFDNLFDRDAEALNRAFEREAPALASGALTTALERAGITPGELDALFVCTCTGYLCPGVSSHVAQRLGMRADAFLSDLVGLGCGAAIPALRSAAGHAASEPDANIAVIAVEICSAAFYMDDDPGVLISLCLFGDGASASVWRGNRPDKTLTPPLRINHFDTVHLPEDRELLRFENAGGKLRNRLHKSVPGRAASAVAHLRSRLNGHAPEAVISHAGGRDVLLALEERLGCGPLGPANRVLANHGNMSSPSVLFALEDYLCRTNGTGPPGSLWLTSFGAGFAAHSCLLSPHA